ncbi:hypothetical protein Tco_1345782 [Tanacetum coccineum]
MYSLEPELVVSFPSGTRNEIFDPGIFIEVKSKRFLSPNEFSISFIRDPLSTVFDTLLPFSSENEEKKFNPGDKSQGQRVKGRKETRDIFLGYFGGKIGLGISGVKFDDLTYLAPQPLLLYCTLSPCGVK